MSGAIARLRDVYHPPFWVTGGLSLGDAMWLAELVERLDPHVVVELGIGAGTSSVALLVALDALPAVVDKLPDGDYYGRCLVSLDVSPTCYFDPRRAVGSAVAEMYPEHGTSWLVLTRADARMVAGALPPGVAVDLAFVDANHKHPYPLIDVLHLAPVLAPGAWIALHDIRLAHVHPEFRTFGAEWLYNAWRHEKVAGTGDAENIGAIRLPVDLAEIVPVALELIGRHPWELTPAAADVGPLADVFAPVARALAPRLRAPLRVVRGRR